MPTFKDDIFFSSKWSNTDSFEMLISMLQFVSNCAFLLNNFKLNYLGKCDVVKIYVFASRPIWKSLKSHCSLTLIVPRAWEIGYMQPCIKCQAKSPTHFVHFWSLKTLPYTHLEATSYIPQQGQSLHIWTTSLSTTGCYKNKYTIQFLWMACISRFATAILSCETELALGTIRVKNIETLTQCIF